MFLDHIIHIIRNTKNKYIFVLLLVPTAFLNIARTDAQDYFPVMDSISEMKLDRVFNMFNDSLSEEKRTAILSREEYNNKIPYFRNFLYSEHLRAMDELVLHLDTFDRPIIRLTWLRGFRSPVVISVAGLEFGVHLSWKTIDGMRGYDPKKLFISRRKRIDIQQWNEIIRQLQKINFWKLPTNRPVSGTYGEQCILEAKIGGKYHIVDRCSGYDSEIGEFCLSLLSITELEIKKEDIY